MSERVRKRIYQREYRRSGPKGSAPREITATAHPGSSGGCYIALSRAGLVPGRYLASPKAGGAILLTPLPEQ